MLKENIIIELMEKSYSHVNNKGEHLDLILDSIFKSKMNGFYIELGANDGLRQSNTAFFEFYRNWTGLLIEPSLDAFLQCRAVRPKSICLNLACVSNTYTHDFIDGDFNGHMMSSVNGARTNNTMLTRVNVATLEKILDTFNAGSIDFLSLDTEGYEYEILCGLNLNKYRPKYMLIEIYNTQYHSLVKFLENNNYRLICNLSNYNKIDNPVWDGTHNDYLFIDSTIHLE